LNRLLRAPNLPLISVEILLQPRLIKPPYKAALRKRASVEGGWL
jgi:hypothetical protein